MTMYIVLNYNIILCESYFKERHQIEDYIVIRSFDLK